ncbi:MAG: mannitol dehydrogenase family protein, partial [Acidimicrobiales bacterium]
MSTEESTQPDGRLTSKTLHAVDSLVAIPTYDRRDLDRSIVHIGVGGFHRAHEAAYIDDLCNEGLTSWSIVG